MRDQVLDPDGGAMRREFGDPGGASPQLGPRRRLTLVPGALSPTSGGSRFSALDEEEDVDPEVEVIVVAVAADVLSEERVVSRCDVDRPVRSEAELAQEFWEYVGFPTKASRF